MENSPQGGVDNTPNTSADSNPQANGGSPQVTPEQQPVQAQPQPQAPVAQPQQPVAQPQQPAPAPAQPAPKSFQEEIGQKAPAKTYTPEQQASFEAGKRVAMREFKAQQEQLAAQQMQAQQPVQPVQPVQQQSAHAVVGDDLKRQVEDVKYMQQRDIAIRGHIAQNADDTRLQNHAIALASQDAYKNLSTKDIFDLARVQNPVAPEPPQQQPVGQQAPPSGEVNVQQGGNAVQRLNAERLRRARETGQPYDPMPETF